MQEQSQLTQQPPQWFVRSCQWLRKRRKVFWGTFFFGLCLNVFATLLLTRWPWVEELNGTPLGWAIQNPFYVFLLGSILFIFDLIIYLGSLLDVGLSQKHIKRRYLRRVIIETATLTLTGIPAGLIAPGVQLDKVFIPLHLVPKRPLTDYPLTEREIEALFRRLRAGEAVEETEHVLFEAERSWASTFEEKNQGTLTDLWKRLTKEAPAAVVQGYPGMGKSTLMNRLALHMARRNLGQADPTMDVIVQNDQGEGSAILFLFLLFFLLLWLVSRLKGHSQPTKQRKWREWVANFVNALFLKVRIAPFVIYLQTRWRFYAHRKEATVQFKPFQIPLLVSLSRYATERSQTPDLSLRVYIDQELSRWNIIGLTPFIEGQLQAGNCLILLDGLDEVSNQQMRQQVQEAIRSFIRAYQEPIQEGSAFNRFLITSRVAGYDQAAFPGVPHYLIAELTESQIGSFLPRWYLANLHQARVGGVRLRAEQRQNLEREATTLANNLGAAITNHQGLHELAENPFLLTLLAVMQQNSIELPRQRVDLYRVVTQTLLENRNLAKGLPTIPETQALHRLGPVAFHLQEQGNGFAKRREVEALLKAAIGQEGGSSEEIAAELEVFLSRIRERTGLFLQRTADYFGFYHRTFQEYFASRYLLSKLGRGSPEEIADLVQRARSRSDLWREPFLLAVAFKSGEDQQLASELIRALITPLENEDIASQRHDLFLAAECIVEAKPLTIDSSLQVEIAGNLLQLYEMAQQSTQFATREQIEVIFHRWLLSVPSAAYRSPVLNILTEYLRDEGHPTHRRATLLLLLMIAHRLRTAPESVFTTLIPILLDLAGLTAQGEPLFRRPLLSSSDLQVADLALLVLSFLETRGPAGTSLPAVRRQFVLNPEHLRLLASHSLECHRLLTPAVMPIQTESYHRYGAVIDQWHHLQNQLKKHLPGLKDANTCLSIHQSVLACAEEVRYPNTYHLLRMLQVETEHPERSWQQCWQDYLTHQLESGHYISYQNVALLWLMLFPEEEAQEKLIALVGAHYGSNQDSLQRYAQRLLVGVSSFHRHQLSGQDGRHLSLPYDVQDLWFVPRLRMLRDLRDLLDLSSLQVPSELPMLALLRSLSDPVNLHRMGRKSAPADLTALLPKHDLALQSIHRLAACITQPSTESDEYIELLTILIGRLLRILKTEEMSDMVEQEVEQLIQTITSHSQLVENPQVREALQELIYYLPARTAKEIALLVRLAEEASEKGIPVHCTFSLSRAVPNTPEARQALESAMHSSVKDVRMTAEKRLRELQREPSAGKNN